MKLIDDRNTQMTSDTRKKSELNFIRLNIFYYSTGSLIILATQETQRLVEWLKYKSACLASPKFKPLHCQKTPFHWAQVAHACNLGY
jgi:hypothetical protein